MKNKKSLLKRLGLGLTSLITIPLICIGIQLYQNNYSRPLTDNPEMELANVRKDLKINKNLKINIDYTSEGSYSSKNIDNSYNILLDFDMGRNEAGLRHELCHIKNGDLDKIFHYKLSERAVYFLWAEPRATICSLGGN
jgi:hypothetical protein